MTNRLGGIGDAFSDRNFRIYSVGSILSWITYFIQNITFSWVAWTRVPARRAAGSGLQAAGRRRTARPSAGHPVTPEDRS